MAEYVCPTCRHAHVSNERPAWYRDPEEWRAIPGWEGLYEASSHGQIRNRKGTVLKQYQSEWGYLRLGLYRAGEGQTDCKVHRLVALAFLPLIEGKTFVNHKNSNKTDNRPENLEWVSREENHAHAMAEGRNHAATNPRRGWKLSVETVALIRQRSAAGEPCRTLAAEYGVNPTYLRKVLNGAKRVAG